MKIKPTPKLVLQGSIKPIKPTNKGPLYTTAIREMLAKRQHSTPKTP